MYDSLWNLEKRRHRTLSLNGCQYFSCLRNGEFLQSTISTILICVLRAMRWQSQFPRPWKHHSTSHLMPAWAIKSVNLNSNPRSHLDSFPFRFLPYFLLLSSPVCLVLFVLWWKKSELWVYYNHFLDIYLYTAALSLYCLLIPWESSGAEELRS